MEGDVGWGGGRGAEPGFVYQEVIPNRRGGVWVGPSKGPLVQMGFSLGQF